MEVASPCASRRGGIACWLVLRRLLGASRLDLAAAFVSNGPDWCFVSPFLSMAGFVFGLSAPVGAAMFVNSSLILAQM